MGRRARAREALRNAGARAANALGAVTGRNRRQARAAETARQNAVRANRPSPANDNRVGSLRGAAPASRDSYRDETPGSGSSGGRRRR